MPSTSPKRGSSKQAKKPHDKDDVLLEASIEGHKVEYPRSLLLAVGLVAGFLPCYVAHAFFHLDWLSLVNLPLFAIVIGVTGHLLSRAYGLMFESDFRKRQRHYQETKTEHDAILLRQLRLQVALAHSIFFVNAVFVAVSTLLQAYILRHFDARVALIVAPLLAASGLWYLAQWNEDTRKRRSARI
jgi:uncharacterized protein YqhQ